MDVIGGPDLCHDRSIMNTGLRNNRLDIGVENEIVCRTRESYEHGTWMTASTTVRNAELKGETRRTRRNTGYRAIFYPRPVDGSSRAKSRAKMIMTGT